MPVQGSDYFGIDRSGVNYKAPLSDVLAYIQANIGTSEFRVADIAARNALTNLSLGDRVLVDDATADATVTTGWALYTWLSAGVWRKITEQESLDVSFTAATNLSYAASPTQGQVNSDTGTDATITAADGTNAGLMLPAQFNKLVQLTVTAATDLDAMRTASHAAVTTAGSGATNPIVVSGQTLSFSIAGLTSAP